jgi:cell division protein FtsN
MQEVHDNSRRVSVGVAAETARNDSTAFFDSSAPEFSAPKENPTDKKKPWKRKLIGWCLILLVVAAGVFALYVLMRVKHVDVRVQAEPQRSSQSAKTEPSPTKSENGLSAEAINIARQAIGADPATNSTAANAPTATSASATPEAQRTLSLNDNSPAYAQLNEAGHADSNSTQTTTTSTRQMADDSPSTTQGRANQTQTLSVEDLPLKPSPTPQTTQPTSRPIEKKPESTKTFKAPPTAAVLPVFGTMLPVRTRGVIFSVRNNSYARLELARDCQGDGWSMSKGTLLIGHVTGSEHDRAFINIVGYIVPGTNQLVKMTGEVIGNDGGAGIQGKRIAVDRNRLKQTLGKVASSGLEVASTMAGALIGRGTVVVNGSGYRMLNPITDEAGQFVNAVDNNRHFVRVEAGQSAYVMVANLPPEVRAVDARGEDDLSHSAASLTDREVMELIVFGTPEDIRAAQSLMNEEQKRLVLKSIAPKD